MLDIACLNYTTNKLVISWGANVDINNAHTQSENVKWSVSKRVGCWSTIPYFRYLQGFSQPVDFEIYSWSKFRRLSFRSSARLKMKRWLYNNDIYISQMRFNNKLAVLKFRSSRHLNCSTLLQKGSIGSLQRPHLVLHPICEDVLKKENSFTWFFTQINRI